MHVPPAPNATWKRLAVVAALAAVLAVLGGVAAGASWAAGYDPSTDPYSMANTAGSLGVKAFWKAGSTGQGIDVALIDSGVSPVQGLDAPGKVVYGPDLSLESQAPNLRNLDTYGHGTFMAGLIAGNDAPGTDYATAPASTYLGTAPDARIISLKVGTADGGTDVSQVIAAVDWVVQHAHDPGLNIRVLNLSYGTNSTQLYASDPLAYAVQQAWKHGIVVVASAGNSGYQRGNGAPGVADPAYDPYVLAAGGADTMGTAKQGDDHVGTYSASASNGSGRAPDFVAPGSHLQGLRDPGSWLDVNHPEGILSDRYFRGTGTSESAAITSGAVALLLSRFPNLTPDQVKAYFVGKAVKLAGANAGTQGAGEIDPGAMVKPPGPSAPQSFPSPTGTGSLELSRGQDHLTRDGIVLTGEQDIFGMPFDSAAMAKLEASASSWSGGEWNGSSWSGSSWSSSSWSGSSWSSSSWSGSSWSGSSWSSSSWSSSSWSGSSWSSSSWSGSSWSGSSWSGQNWAGGDWN